MNSVDPIMSVVARSAARPTPLRGVQGMVAWVALCLAMSAVAVSPLAADQITEAETVSEAFDKSEFRLSLRYRFEHVEQDGVARSAEASTLRSTLSMETASLRRFTFFVEAENVAELGDDRFANGATGDLSNDAVGRPVVADVAQTELNQVYARFAPGSLELTAGRRELNLGDQRLVGAVGWRQNHQSFDLLSVGGQATPRVAWSYAYLDRVHRIFGDSRDIDGHLLSLGFDTDRGALRLYGLELDYRKAAFAGGSTRTLGAEIVGDWPLLEKLQLLFEAELALQTDTGDNPAQVEASYHHLMAGLKYDIGTLSVGREVLEGSAADGRFNTPLATLHKFNGWADKFLSTPPDGLEDLYLSLAAGQGAWHSAATFHVFEAQSSNSDYGRELDVVVSWKSSWGQSFALKLADYEADDFSVDTTKWMLWSSYSL